MKLAWIEHAMSRAFVAADAAPLPAAALEGIDWDAATVILVPSACKFVRQRPMHGTSGLRKRRHAAARQRRSKQAPD
ncbi:hypothetical protein ACU4GD_09985 [Cupriavidus basilensis]